MVETLIGSVFGLASRMLPEALKWLDRKNERAHELAMFDKQLSADKLKTEQTTRLAQITSDNTIATSELQALIEATKAQGIQTGIRWIDALSSLMRPIITFWWVIVFYTANWFAEFWILHQTESSPQEVLKILWGNDEKAIVASIIAFWFVDRSLRKK
jgi:hypothetical protein